MKPLTCEMCGSTNLIKQDGIFVCQSCGTKYSVEEAKKMMVEGTVSVKGTVEIDTSSLMKNIYEVARRAKETDNCESALKYYEMILIKDPNSWEANFYVVYYRLRCCRSEEFNSAAQSFINSLDSIFALIKELPESEQSVIVTEIYNKLWTFTKELLSSMKMHYDDDEIRVVIRVESADGTSTYNSPPAVRVLYAFGDKLVEHFGDSKGDFAASLWDVAITMHLLLRGYDIKKGEEEMLLEYAAKTKKYMPEYDCPYNPYSGHNDYSLKKKQPQPKEEGCYIATAVYGSYDCPEVWTLRRFRDSTLAATWYGRSFIRAYYAVSPTLVKWFGNKEWVKRIWRKQLNRLIENLQKSGVESTPYIDRH